MPSTSKKIIKKTAKKQALAKKHTFIVALKRPLLSVQLRVRQFMARRPHRSFRLTRRRDYHRSLQLPGYFAFTKSVNKTILQHKKIFIGLAVVYGVLSFILVGIGSQATYAALTSTLQDTGLQIFQGNFGQLGQAGVIFASVALSGLSATPSQVQQIYIIILGLLVWLTTVWLLRHLIAGHTVKMRDGLYSAGAPIITTLLVVIVMVLQLLPIILALIGYSAASSTGLLDSGVSAMLFWIVAGLLTLMSLYWTTSTFFALIIVTLPGMYPMKALKTAGDMVVGRRLRILYRILWMFGSIIVAAALFLIPIILIVTWLTGVWPAVGTVPIVPVALLLFSTVAFIWGASYIYLLYRKVVDDDAQPA